MDLCCWRDHQAGSRCPLAVCSPKLEMIISIHTASFASLAHALFKFSSHYPPTTRSSSSHPFHIHPLPVESCPPASAVPSDALLSIPASRRSDSPPRTFPVFANLGAHLGAHAARSRRRSLVASSDSYISSPLYLPSSTSEPCRP
jgi:hypothetical protein